MSLFLRNRKESQGSLVSFLLTNKKRMSAFRCISFLKNAKKSRRLLVSVLKNVKESQRSPVSV